MYKLHGFSQSGNTYKVALLLEALQQPWTPVHVPFDAFAEGITRSQDWRQANNEMGEVPILEIGDRKLSQSGAIMIHLAAKHGAFGGQSEDEHLEVLRWLFFDNHKFTSHFAAHRFLKSFGPAAPDPAVLAFLRTRIDSAYGIVDQRLQSQDFMMGNAPTIVDFSMCGYGFYPQEETGYDLDQRFPAVAAWLRRLQGLPGWKAPYDLLPGERLAPKW